MIVNKECLHQPAELTIDRLISGGIQSGWSNNYHITLLSGNINILMDVELKEHNTSDQYGVELIIQKGNATLAEIAIPDCRMFSRSELSEQASAWKKRVHDMLVGNYSTWLSYMYVNTDPLFLDWINKAKQTKTPVSLNIDGINFKTYIGVNSAWFQVGDGKVVLYRVERTNYIGMTTKQGWQGMSPSTIKGESLRVIRSLLHTRDGFLFPVSL